MPENSSNSINAELYIIYNEKIRPKFIDLEKERVNILKDIINKIIFICFLPALLITTIIIYLVQNTSNMPNIITLSAFLILISPEIYIALGFYGIINLVEGNKRFKNRIKHYFLQEVLNKFSNIYWNKSDNNNIIESIFSDKEIEESGLFVYSYKRTDNEFQGTYKNVPFKISEIKFFDGEESNSKSATDKGIFLYEKITIYEGIILSFKYNKTINSRTIVSSKNYDTIKEYGYQYFLAYLIVSLLFLCPILSILNYFQYEIIPNIFAIVIILMIITVFTTYSFLKNKEESIEEPLNEVKLEDPKFSKRFNVYSSDQIEARYLVTTAFMERFYNLKTAFGAKKIKCSFYGDTLMIAIHTKKDLFEFGSLFRSLNDSKQVKILYEELTSIYKIIDCLKQYENFGL